MNDTNFNDNEELNIKDDFEYDISPMQPQNSKDVAKTTFDLDSPFVKFPDNFPKEPEFAPPYPQKKYHSFVISYEHLTKRIYLEMLRAIREYDKLENIAPAQDKNLINNLKNQMEILSIAILNIYKNNYPKSKLPIFSVTRTSISNNYQTALKQMYNRVYHILELTNKLYIKTLDNTTKSTLLIVIANLKSQLKKLNELRI